MKLPISIFSFLLSIVLWLPLVNAQTNQTAANPTNEDLLQLQALALGMQTESTEENRMAKCYEFIPALVGYLKNQPQPYQTDLSSLEQISILEAPDKTFKILSWTVELDVKQRQKINTIFQEAQISSDKGFKYFGAILYNQPKLKIIPLSDKSEENRLTEDDQTSNKNWYGCIYYNIFQKTYNGNPLYVLLGWDGATGQSTRKVMELLTFDNENNPVFGLPIIDVVRDDSLMVKSRFIHEYRSGSGVSLNYDNDKDLVIFDYIKAPDQESKGIYPTYIPDGTYAGLTYKNNRWEYVTRVYQGQNISEQDLKAQRNERISNEKNTKKKRKKRKKR